ncbi:AtzG-like protein [Methylobacterium sp. A52T]
MSETRPPYDPESYAAAAAALLGLTLDPAWIAPVTANLRVLAAAAELVEAFPLADAIDAAPRFEA